MQEIARIEHEYIEQLRALADASVAINASMSVEEILQLTADAARAGARGGARLDRDPGRGAAAPAARRDVAARPRGLHGDTCAHEREPAGAGARARLARGRRRPEREFTRRDDALLTQLGQLASGAIANARLYGRERTIARTLQRSLRPGALPPVPGLSAAVRFNAAGEGVELGGDFYDLYRARDGGWAALIGDIQGKGPEAAAVTALARHTLRAAAAYEHRPSGVLTLLHRELREQVSDGRFCTVAYAYMQVVPGHVRLELACGGHPLPFVVHTDGSVEEVGRLGTLLGSDAEPLLADVVVELEKGDVLVLYTDGVTEVRRQRREVFGTEQLIELLQTCGGLSPGGGGRAGREGGHARLDGPVARRYGRIGARAEPRGAAIHPRGERWLTYPPRRRRATVTARRRKGSSASSSPTCARTGRSCARSGPAGSRRRSC